MLASRLYGPTRFELLDLPASAGGFLGSRTPPVTVRAVSLAGRPFFGGLENAGRSLPTRPCVCKHHSAHIVCS